jgi:hypothetical protein
MQLAEFWEPLQELPLAIKSAVVQDVTLPLWWVVWWVIKPDVASRSPAESVIAQCANLYQS